MNGVRVCRRCGTEKRLADFCKDARSKYGYRWFCLTCYRRQVRERYYRHKAEKMG